MIELYSKNTYIGKACPSSDLFGFYSRKAHLPPEGKAFIRSERGGFLFFVQSAAFAQKLYTCHPLLIVIVLKTKYHIIAIICKGMDRDCLSVPL